MRYSLRASYQLIFVCQKGCQHIRPGEEFFEPIKEVLEYYSGYEVLASQRTIG